MSNITVTVSEFVVKALEKSIQEAIRQSIMECAKQYGFDGEAEVLRQTVVVKKEVVEKKVVEKKKVVRKAVKVVNAVVEEEEREDVVFEGRNFKKDKKDNKVYEKLYNDSDEKTWTEVGKWDEEGQKIVFESWYEPEGYEHEEKPVVKKQNPSVSQLSEPTVLSWNTVAKQVQVTEDAEGEYPHDPELKKEQDKVIGNMIQRAKDAEKKDKVTKAPKAPKAPKEAKVKEPKQKEPKTKQTVEKAPKTQKKELPMFSMSNIYEVSLTQSTKAQKEEFEKEEEESNYVK